MGLFEYFKRKALQKFSCEKFYWHGWNLQKISTANLSPFTVCAQFMCIISLRYTYEIHCGILTWKNGFKCVSGQLASSLIPHSTLTQWTVDLYRLHDHLTSIIVRWTFYYLLLTVCPCTYNIIIYMLTLTSVEGFSLYNIR